MKTFALTSPIRFRVSGGDAFFYGPDGTAYDNTVMAGRWANLGEGDVLELVGKSEKGDVFQVACTLGDGETPTFGMVVRRDSFAKIEAASASDEPAEPEVAFGTDITEIPAKEDIVDGDPLAFLDEA